MKILFIHGALNIGGVETLIVRAARYLSEREHAVTLLLMSPQPGDAVLTEEASRYSTILHIERGGFSLIGLRLSPSSLRELIASNFDYIYCFNSDSLIVGLLLKQQYLPTARIVTGVYNPTEYCFSRKKKLYRQHASSRKLYRQALVEDIFRKIPLSNVFFMNEANLRTHSVCLGRDFGSSPIVPLPIDMERFTPTKRQVNRRKIISIGRIAAFKTYNFHMVDVVKELKDKGYDFEYHIYGDGPLFDELRNYIFELGMERFVFLHGTLPYARMSDVLTDAFVFVGEGTSLVEAAACGVPALMAVLWSNKPTTYGLFHETSGYNLGEPVPDQEQFLLVEKIEGLYRLNPSDYEAASAGSVQRAQAFSMEAVMRHFLQSLNNSVTFSYRITPLMKILNFAELLSLRLLRLQ